MKVLNFHRALAMSFLAAAVLIFAGCNGSGSPPPPPPPPTLSSIAVTPAKPSIGVGATQQFTATGTFSDTSTKDVTSTVTWSSGTTTVATISTGGLATSIAQGTSTITATSGAIFGNALLTVLPPALQSIKIIPANPTIPISGTVDFTGVGLYSDGSTKPLAGITFASGTTATASIISTSGVALGLAAGTSTITASGGGVTGTTVLTVVAAASRFAYVANGGNGSISIYAVNGSTFTPHGYVYDVNSAIEAIPDPSGRFVFALNVLAQNISTYYVDPVTGGLTDASTLATPIAPVSNGPGAGFQPYRGIIDPTGRFLYVANAGANNVTAFAISTANGSLTEIGSPVSVGKTPTMVIADRAGKFLYVINNIDGTISGFSIDPNTGALTGLSTVPAFPVLIGATSNPVFATIDLQNKLYVADFGDDSVAGYSIDPNTGALTKMAGSPFKVVVGAGPFAVVVDPSSKYLYVANSNLDSVSGYPLDSSGIPGTTTPLFATPVSTSPTGTVIGAFPFSLSIDPAGKFVAAVNQGSNTVALFSLNSANGVLTATGNIETRSTPGFADLYIASSAPTLAAADVFAANMMDGTISAYTVTPGTGALTPTTGPVPGKPGNSLSTTDVTGQFFYTTSASTKYLLGFNVTESSAALAKLNGSPFFLATSVPSSVVAEPSDRFVYTAATGASGSVLSFGLDTKTNTLSMLAGIPPSFAGLNAILEDPQGQELFGLGTNAIQILTINTTSGGVNAGTPFSPAPSGTWTSGAVDASGQYLLALDKVGKQIQVFYIGSTAPAPVPFGTAVATVSTGGTSPSSLVIDPLNRFVLVTDAGANNIIRFSFNPSANPLTGVLTPLVGTTALAGAPGQASIDATGTYLYVAVEGNPVTNAGGVAAFQIVFTPGSLTLTAVPGSPFLAGVGTTGVAVSNSIK